MAKRHISSLARLNREGDADDPRLHVIETGGFGIEGKQRCRFQLFQPAVKLGFVQNAAVVGFDGGNRSGVVIASVALSGALAALFTTRFQLLDQVAQLIFAIDRQQGLLVDRLEQQLFQTLFQLDISLDGRQSIGETNLLLLLAELVGERLGATEAERGYLVEVGGNLVDAANPL